MKWRLADAKNKFSELMTRALSEGPQEVSRRHETVVVLAQRDYKKLIGKHISFKTFLMENDSDFTDLDLTRDKSPMRDTDI